MEREEKRRSVVQGNEQFSHVGADIKVGLIVAVAYIALFGSIVTVGVVYGWLWGAILGFCLLTLAGTVVLRFRSWW